MRAMTMLLLGRGEQAEKILYQIGVDGREDSHHWATLRAANLIWMLGRLGEAASILEGLAAAPESEAEQAARAAVEACADAVYGRCVMAAEKARAALNSGNLTDYHAMIASVALVMALGALGQVDDIAAVAKAAIDRAITSFQSSQMRFWFGAVYARACRLTGRVHECTRSVNALAESARDIPGLAYANLASLLGHAALARGAVPEAVRRCCMRLWPASKGTVSLRVCAPPPVSDWRRRTPSSDSPGPPTKRLPKHGLACQPISSSCRPTCRWPPDGHLPLAAR
jgi:hypothetical protein